MLKMYYAIVVFLAVSCAPAEFNRPNYPVRQQTDDINNPQNPVNTNPTNPFVPFNPDGFPNPDYVGDQVPGVTVTNGGNGTTTYSLKCKIPPALEVLNGPRSTGIQFKGEICPVSTNELVIMLVNDESGSMREADGAALGGIFGCGRHSAAKALLNYVDSVSGDGDRIFVGLVGFATSARVKSQLVPLKDFKRSYVDGLFSKTNFCVSQTGDAAATNYDHALVLAQQELTRKTQLGLSAAAPEAVFVISDGMPTASRNVPFADNPPVVANGMTQAQLDGINSSRIFSPYTTISALYLHNPVYAPTSNIDPRVYLNQLTQDPSRVVIASDAAQLASKMTELALPGLEIIPSSIRITQSAAGNVYQFVNTPGDYTFSADPIRKNVYNFQTKYVQPMVNGGSTTDNVFRIELQARHKDGRLENISSQLTVRFTPTN